MPDQIAISFKDVCFAYERDEVLHNVTLPIEKGSLLAVVGPNGGGKSTLVKLALGLIAPTRGHVEVFGETPERSHRRIGYVPQHLHYDQAFPVSALDVVLMGRAERHWIGPYRRTDRDTAKAALERVGLSSLANRGLSQLSGGERQRVLIAQALVSDPDLLLLDEPTANVDSVVEHEIYELLHELNACMTIVVVSHNLNVVTRYASHVACVNRTASILPMAELTEAKLHAVFRGDVAVLRHERNCQVIDPANLMRTPHHACAREEKQS